MSDVYPGSISDDDITAVSGILKLARKNKRWLADNGWQCDGDKFGLIIETPDRLEGKAQFSEAVDMKNRQISRLRIHVERVIRRMSLQHFAENNPNSLRKCTIENLKCFCLSCIFSPSSDQGHRRIVL